MPVPSQRRPLGCPICREPLRVSSHGLHQQSTVESIQSLLLLQHFMRSVPLDDFKFYFGQMDVHIQRWLAKIPPANVMIPVTESVGTATGTIQVADIASSFSFQNFLVSQPHTKAVAGVTNPGREQMVLRWCADLLLDTFSSPRVQQILLSTTAIVLSGQIQIQGVDKQGGSAVSCRLFRELISDVTEEISRMLVVRNTNAANSCYDLHSGRPNSLAALVDEILTLIYAEPKYRQLRGYASKLLLGKDNILDVAVHTAFGAFLSQYCQTHDTMDLVQTLGEWKSTSTGMFPVNERRSNPPTECGWTSHTDRLLDIVAARWNRRWFMVPASVFITPLASDTDASNASLSLLLTVALVRLLASIDVKLEKSSLTIATAVTESTLPPLACFGMALQLDGQAHTLTSLPNGVTITTA
ncbi:hypothetical protein F442_03899, partial [Phytophthora nicotianae P10297]